MVEVVGESLDEVDEVGVVGDEAMEELQLLLFFGDRVLHALRRLLGLFCRVQRRQSRHCALHALFSFHFLIGKESERVTTGQSVLEGK